MIILHAVSILFFSAGFFSPFQNFDEIYIDKMYVSMIYNIFVEKKIYFFFFRQKDYSSEFSDGIDFTVARVCYLVPEVAHVRGFITYVSI